MSIFLFLLLAFLNNWKWKRNLGIDFQPGSVLEHKNYLIQNKVIFSTTEILISHD